MYYYIYQSFLLKPPVKDSNSRMVASKSDIENLNSSNRLESIRIKGNEEDDREFKIARVKSKVHTLIDNMNRI